MGGNEKYMSSQESPENIIVSSFAFLTVIAIINVIYP
jgi:hypothetical protein